MTGRRGATLAIVLVVAVAGCAGERPSTSGSTGTEGTAHAHHTGEDATSWRAVDDHDALFTVDCDLSHRLRDDPIVLPGRPGSSHSHDFFGSTAADAHSTGAGLRGTATTCRDQRDTASYWVPTLMVDGAVVDPLVLRAYYRARPGVDVRMVAAPPLGLAMIAGDPARTVATEDATPPAPTTGTTVPADDAHQHDHGPAPLPAGVDPDDPTAQAGWGCGLTPRTFAVLPPDTCTDPSPLTLRLRFPDCWDGENLDSPDHRSHVARSVDGRCPPTHPVLMAELQVSVQWPVTGAEGRRVTLASGSPAGAHGDFLNGWDPRALEDHVALCIHHRVNCTIG